MTPTSRTGKRRLLLGACAVGHERIHQAEAASLQQIDGWDVFHIDTSRQVWNGCGITGLQGGVECGLDDAWWGAWGRRDVIESRHAHAEEVRIPRQGPRNHHGAVIAVPCMERQAGRRRQRGENLSPHDVDLRLARVHAIVAIGLERKRGD